MKTSRKIVLILIFLLTVTFSYSAFRGIEIGNFKIKSMKEKMDLGLDLAGGVYVILEAQTKEKGEELNKKMEQTKAIISQRVNGLGVSEPNIVIEGDKRIRLELAGVKDPKEAIDMIGKTALLEFKNPEGKVILTGENIKNSNVMYNEDSVGMQVPVVSLEFDKKGAEIFRTETARLVALPKDQDRSISIVLDGNIISRPNVNAEIKDGKAIIEGDFTTETASELSNLINAGALPLEMKELQSSVIGPTLGMDALQKSIFAGAIGIAIVFLFMISLYRLPGILASFTLVIYILLVLNTMNLFGVKLTLPGIAAMILSIGMAVDANIIIFERIKEEYKAGKSIKKSVESGFSRGLITVIDSNITTLIAGIVLYIFGTGPIKGFGVTLMIGLVISMLTAVILTKFLLKSVVRTKIGQNEKLMGL